MAPTAAVHPAANYDNPDAPIGPRQHHQQHHQQQEQPCSLLCWARRKLHAQQQRREGLRDNFGDREVFAGWNRTDARRPTQGSAYTNSAGPDEGDKPGDPFTAYSTEPTSVTAPSGVYYHEGVCWRSNCYQPAMQAWAVLAVVMLPICAACSGLSCSAQHHVVSLLVECSRPDFIIVRAHGVWQQHAAV